MTAALRLLGVANATTIALSYLLVVLFVASLGDVVTAVVTSVTAMLCFNFFFMPPVGTFTIADPQNWVALVAFLVVSVVASRLSTSARAKAQEALDRRNELTRLFDVSRDILLTTEREGALAAIARHVSRRFELGIVAIALERSEFLEERRGAELARQRAELSSALLASLSHDLRTPLTAIRTAVSNLDSDVLPEDQRRDQARVASGQLDRLTRLFDEILDMARIDAGTVQPQHSWVAPAEVVDAALAHASSALAGRDVRVDARDDVAVEIDPRLAASALAHLLENAAQYAPQGPIDVRGWSDGEGLRLEVRDEGPGLQAGELEQLFEPFYRGELLRHRVPGTGMGLAIMRGLVAADRGRVWAENIAPRG